MDPIYDELGITHSVTCCTDPRIAQQLYAELLGAARIVNIDAGTGSYEPECETHNKVDVAFHRRRKYEDH